MKSVCVIIPVYNRANFILDALESVYSQSQLPNNVVVVDDGSTDNTVERINDWRKTKRTISAFNLEIVVQKNQGASIARRHGFNLAGPNSDAVLFLDSDDILPVDFFQRTLPLMFENDVTSAVSVDQIFLSKSETHRRSLDAISAHPMAWLLRVDAGISSCTLVKTSSVRQIDGYNDANRTGGDLLFFFQIAQTGQWKHAPGDAVIMRIITDESKDVQNLSRRYPDRFIRWAAIAEDAILNRGGTKHLSTNQYAPHISRMWQRALANYCDFPGQTLSLLEIEKKVAKWREIAEEH